jgi:hypothetical protein
MKTYLSAHAFTAVIPHKGQLKRFITLLITLGLSVVLLANNSPCYSLNNISKIDTTITSGVTDQHINIISGDLTAGISGSNSGDEFSLPLVMTAFKVLLNDKKVVLSWTIGKEKRLSHFVVERSTNGVEYKEAEIIFAMTAAGSVKENYSVSDPVNLTGKGVLYYRIKIVDVHGKYQNSAVKLIRIGEENAVLRVQAYPNPVLDEVRITVPQNWQNKQVSYEIYDNGGRMVKRITSNYANQTEILNVQDCKTGLYVVKAYTATEAGSQIIVKK